jgi:hypothetical protein
VDAVEAIPVAGIFLTDAFSRVFRATTPHWRDLQDRLTNPGSGEDWEGHDHAEWGTNKLVRSTFTDGSLTPLIYRHGLSEKLPREGWELRGQFETGITSNFVAPNDPINPGPRTDIDGQRHAVFIDRVEFDGWFNSMFPTPARQAEQVVPALHRGGKKKGDGSYKNVDAPLQREMKSLIRQGKATSVRGAARLVVGKAHGAGIDASKIERLAKGYNQSLGNAPKNSEKIVRPRT